MKQEYERTLITPAGVGPVAQLKEVYAYRDLLWTLAYRDFRVRYAQAALGLTWAVVQPAALLAVLSFLFGAVVGVETGGTPYPLFALAGMIGWIYFASVLGGAGTSLVSAQHLIKKVYFPRLIVPLARAVVATIDFGVACLLYLILMLYYGHYPGATLMYLPFYVAATMATSLGAALWVSALTIRFRDLQHALPFVVQIGLYLTPVAYPASLVPERFVDLYFLNPMAGAVVGIRWSLLGGAAPPALAILSLVGSTLFLAAAVCIFARIERTMADFV